MSGNMGSRGGGRRQGHREDAGAQNMEIKKDPSRLRARGSRGGGRRQGHREDAGAQNMEIKKDPSRLRARGSRGGASPGTPRGRRSGRG
jgi:hypothetical protein